MSKTAVVLFNLGGPDKPESVQPYLFNIFNDAAIISVPMPSFARWCLAKFISIRRAPPSRELYGFLGGGTPLLKNTEAQARALESTLAETMPPEDESRTFIVMRYWHPFAAETVREVADYDPDLIVLLPLYPQYSTTTTQSSFEDWHSAARKSGLNVPTRAICCYPHEDGFVDNVTTLIADTLSRSTFLDHPIRILLSAHGLPERIIRGGDPYQWQIEVTAAAITDRLEQRMDLPPFETVLCYQSEVGPLKWIGPSTESEIERAAEDGSALVVVPIAFVSEHLETLVELDIEYAELAEEHGVPVYVRVPAVSTGESFIIALSNIVRQACEHGRALSSSIGPRICPNSWTKCAFETLAVDH